MSNRTIHRAEPPRRGKPAIDLAQGAMGESPRGLDRTGMKRGVEHMKTIVAATDFSKAGNQAVLRGAEIAARKGERLRIFHASSFRIAPEQAAHFAALVEGYFDTLRARIQCRYGPRLEVDGTHADIWQDIHRVLTQQNAELLVVGQHVHPNGIDAFHGTFVERLAADCAVPVLVSTSAPEAPYRRALVAIDPSPENEKLIPVIRDVAPGSAIALMQVAPAEPGDELSCGPGGAAANTTLKQGARTIERLRDQTGLDPETEILMVKGNPRDRIRRLASARKLDLVALAGTGPMQELNGDFLRTPPCDLLVFPTAARRMTDTAFPAMHRT
ncbi:MAG: universal stress protein [Limimaricola soesokkakensis]|uniref:universal stress protein n=1 Tax=Limimaricola soesokkakensis TaxID=1343159 RepID=UPI0040580D66